MHHPSVYFGGAETAAALCFQGSYKLLLTLTVLIYSDIHWSQPGEKRMTGGTNWQPKAAPTTTWNPVSMVTHTDFHCIAHDFCFCCIPVLFYWQISGFHWYKMHNYCCFSGDLSVSVLIVILMSLFSQHRSWPSLPPHRQA